MSMCSPSLTGPFRGFWESKDCDEVYLNHHWPPISRAIDLILQSSLETPVRISFEETYSAVYKLVCDGYGSVLQNDLIHKKIETYSDWLAEPLQLLKEENVKEYIERFNETLLTFIQKARSILAVFAYLDRIILEHNLAKVLYKTFTDRLLCKHMSIVLGYLSEAEKKPFTVEPSTFANIIKSLYLINPDFAELNPDMFSKFIPGYGHTGAHQLHQLSIEAKEMYSSLENCSDMRMTSSGKRSLDTMEESADMDNT